MILKLVSLNKEYIMNKKQLQTELENLRNEIYNAYYSSTKEETEDMILNSIKHLEHIIIDNL
jgi:hypothetical protein